MNPQVLRAAERAMAKANALRPSARALYDFGTGHWHVASATTDQVYIVFRYSYQYSPSDPWWVAYGCTCAAAEAGLQCCWHKALVSRLHDEGEAATTLA
jgi:hypothetical protein